MPVSSVSVLICTHRRPGLLAETLSAVASLERPSDCDLEVVVVDNRSDDRTRDVVEAAAAADRTLPIRYAYEPQLGKSYALNRGLALTTGEIVALTDDDIIPSRRWLSEIVSCFRGDADLQFVGGKILPRWEAAAPPELLDPRMQPSWGPLGLLDLGDSVRHYDGDPAQWQHPIGGNVAFRRSSLMKIGAWRVDLGKVNNSLICGEDHDIFFRLQQHGLYAGVYDPEMVVHHFIPAQKLNRMYFRRWFHWRGRTLALMAAEIYRPLDLSRCPRILGVPRFILRQTLEQIGGLLRDCLQGDSVDRLIAQVQTAQYFGMCSGFLRLWIAGQRYAAERPR